jgi:hypothetical protein
MTAKEAEKLAKNPNVAYVEQDAYVEAFRVSVLARRRYGTSIESTRLRCR